MWDLGFSFQVFRFRSLEGRTVYVSMQTCGTELQVSGESFGVTRIEPICNPKTVFGMSRSMFLQKKAPAIRVRGLTYHLSISRSIYLSICICVCININININIYIYIYVCVCVCVYIYIYLFFFMHTCMWRQADIITKCSDLPNPRSSSRSGAPSKVSN